jgi:hypothetical protein
MPSGRSNYTIRTERFCKVCNAKTSQVSIGCRHSVPDEITVPSVLVRSVTWVCQWCDGEEVETKEVPVPTDRIKLIRRFLSLSDDYDISGLEIQSLPDELVLHVRFPNFDMNEMRAIQFKQEETGFITVAELMKVRGAGYKRPGAVPPKPEPKDVATLRKKERQQAFAGVRTYD